MDRFEYFCTSEGIVYAQNHSEGFEFPVLVFDSIRNLNVRRMYKVVCGGEMRDENENFIERKKFWELVE